MAISTKVSDCKDDGCGECDVCRYLSHLEHAAAVAPRDIPSIVERDKRIEEHLDANYPGWRN